jgi:hypothetical protein
MQLITPITQAIPKRANNTDAVDTHWLTITNVGVGESMMETYSIPSSDAAVTILAMTSIYEIGLGRFDNTGSSFLGG